MSIDFTISIYKKLLKSLIAKGYLFCSIEEYLKNGSGNPNKNRALVLLRHDVDRLPNNSLLTAEIEYSMGIKATYYFRAVPESYNIRIIKKINSRGHEIGYHYEDVDLILRGQKSKIKSHKDENELIDLAYGSFNRNLEKLRNVADIRTICMHGSPLSKFDNKIIWEKYDYRDLGILGEPYFDINWNEFAYFTDTGRCWNGNNVSVRDKVNTKYNFNFKYTTDIINNVIMLPAKLMITTHPQRWNNNIYKWANELIAQSGKNIIKKYFYVKT